MSRKIIKYIFFVSLGAIVIVFSQFNYIRSALALPPASTCFLFCPRLEIKLPAGMTPSSITPEGGSETLFTGSGSSLTTANSNIKIRYVTWTGTPDIDGSSLLSPAEKTAAKKNSFQYTIIINNPASTNDGLLGLKTSIDPDWEKGWRACQKAGSLCNFDSYSQSTISLSNNYLYFTTKVRWFPFHTGWKRINSRIPMSSVIRGDVYGKDDVDLSNYIIEGNSVVAGGANNIIAVCADCKKITDYTIDFTRINTLLDKNISDLEKKAISVDAVILQNNHSWNLNSSRSGIQNPYNPSSNPKKNPEGGIWMVSKTTLNPNGDLIISSPTTFQKRGTIIVPGDLTINANIPDHTAVLNSEDQLGFIVLGEVKIKSTVTKLSAAIYSDHSITFVGIDTNSLIFDGFLVAKENITLPTSPSNSELSYNPYINPNPPKVALPGFGVLQASILSRTELAP